MMKLSPILFIASLLFCCSAADAATVCKISGTVMEITTIERAVTSDGAPSLLAPIEKSIAVKLDGGTAKEGDAAACVLKTPGETRKYKFCANVDIRPGMRIEGVEGDMAGIGNAPRCLFDVTPLK